MAKANQKQLQNYNFGAYVSPPLLLADARRLYWLRYFR